MASYSFCISLFTLFFVILSTKISSLEDRLEALELENAKTLYSGINSGINNISFAFPNENKKEDNNEK